MTIETLINLDLNKKNFKNQSNHNQNETFLKSNSNFTNLKITINHWQLRDLVQSSSVEPNKILFTCKDQLRSYNYKTHKITNYCKLDFQPRCFAEKDGILISGGVASNKTNDHHHHHTHLTTSRGSSSSSISSTSSGVSHLKGLLNIYNKELDINNTVNVGSLINNNVSLDKVSNYKYHSLVSNNDYCLYSCDIENNGKVNIKDEINLGFAVNHASLSPDKKMVVACGDSKRIVLLHQDMDHSSNNKQTIPSHKKISLKTSYDSGISTLFSADGKLFSCAFQDGITVVYDVRNYKKPLHTIYSTRPRAQHGAFRCCKFSGGTDDFLIISEHTGRVHIVDTRNFDKHQVVLLPKLIYSDNGMDGGIYHEPLVREYQDALSTFNGLSDSNIRYNVNSEYLYLSNGILSDNERTQEENHSNNEFDSVVIFDEDCDLHNNNNITSSSNLEQVVDEWAEMDQETSYDSQLASDHLYTNSNNMFSVNNQFTGRRVSPSRFNDDQSEYRLMYDDSLVDINGIDWYCDPNTGKSHLLVGCDKGLFRWDVDSWSRRCFPTYEVC